MTDGYRRPPGSGASWIGVALLALAFVLAAAVAGPGVMSMVAADTWTPFPTVEEALRQGVQARAAAYAGECAKTRLPEDIGKVCSKFVAERGATRAYLVGHSFSEFSRWLFVEQTDDGWRVAGTAVNDASARTPVIPWPPERGSRQ